MNEEKRNEVRDIKTAISEKQIAFERNLAEDKTELWFTRDELAGERGEREKRERRERERVEGRGEEGKGEKERKKGERRGQRAEEK